MEPIERKNPRLFCIANALPTISAGHDFEEIAENCAESAITKELYTSNANIASPGTTSTSGYIKHTDPEINNDRKATRPLPHCWLLTPPHTAPSNPTPITANDHNDTSSGVLSVIAEATSQGTIVQNAYNSHMCPKQPNADARKRLILKL